MNLQALAQFHFLRPELLLLLPGPLLVYWFVRRREDARQRWKGLIAGHLLEHLLVGRREGRRLRPVHLVAAVLLAAIVAAAGPAWERELPPFAEETAPMVVVLQLSQSMDAIDVAPTRLERAKQKVRDLVRLRPGARTGLFVYGATAHMVLPLTDDGGLMETFRAAPNPAYGAEIEPPAEEAEIEEAPAAPGWRQTAGRWAGPLGVILAAGGLVYLLVRRLVPKLWRRITERREAYRRSETAAFRELTRACRSGSAEDCLRSLYRWVDRVSGPSGTATVQELAERAGSPEFLRRTLPLLRQDPGWDRRAWLASAREVRTKLRRRERARVQGMELPPLNPTSPGPAST